MTADVHEGKIRPVPLIGGAAVFIAAIALTLVLADGEDEKSIPAAQRPRSRIEAPQPSQPTTTTVPSTPAAPPSTTTSTREESAERYIGLRYDGVLAGQEQFPDGVDHLGGGLLVDGSLEETKDPLYSFEHVRDEGGKEALWLERVLSPRGAAESEFEVVDAVDVPPRKDGDTLEFECKLGERDDPEIVTVARFDATPYSRFSSRILAAWRLNRRTERIESISPEGVSCLDPAAGSEGALSEATLPDRAGRYGSEQEPFNSTV